MMDEPSASPLTRRIFGRSILATFAILRSKSTQKVNVALRNSFSSLSAAGSFVGVFPLKMENICAHFQSFFLFVLDGWMDGWLFIARAHCMHDDVLLAK